MEPITIAAIRHALGLSAQQLAELLGVHQRSVQDWESGTNRISATNAHNLHELSTAHAHHIRQALQDAANGAPVHLPPDRSRNQRIAFAAAVLAQHPDATFIDPDTTANH